MQEQHLKELAWALERLAEECPKLFMVWNGSFRTRVGGLRLSVPLTELASLPHDIVVRHLAAEAESAGEYFAAHRGPDGWTVEYSDEEHLFVTHPMLLVAMILARIGEVYPPEDLL